MKPPTEPFNEIQCESIIIRKHRNNKITYRKRSSLDIFTVIDFNKQSAAFIIKMRPSKELQKLKLD